MRSRQTALGIVPAAEFATRHAATVDDYICSAVGNEQIKGASIVSGVSEDSIRSALRELSSRGHECEYTIQGPRGTFTIITHQSAAGAIKPGDQSIPSPS